MKLLVQLIFMAFDFFLSLQQNVPERRLLVNMLQSNVVVDMMKLVFSGNRSSPPQLPQSPKDGGKRDARNTFPMPNQIYVLNM